MHSVTERVNFAQEYVDQRRFGDAVVICSQVLREVPNEWNALALLIVAASQCGAQATALVFLNDAVSRAPIEPAAQYFLGICAGALGEDVIAKTALRHALCLSPTSADAHAEYAKLLARHGCADEARAHARHALALNPEVAALDEILESTADAGSGTRMPEPRGFSAAHPRMVARDADPRLAVFVSDNPSAREEKLAAALHGVGWRVILLFRNDPKFNPGKYFARCIKYSGPLDAVEIAAKLSPRLYHVFPQMNYDVATAFVARRPGIVVCDPYDQLTGVLKEEFFDSNPSFGPQRALERYCYENSDAICCRHLETQVVRRTGDVHITAPRLLYPEYAWGSNATGHKLGAEDDRLHVVCGGTVSIEKEGHPNEFSYVWLAKLLAGFGVHFHLYPINAVEADFDDYYAPYLDLQKSSAYVHVHRPVSTHDWLRNAAQYDVLAIIPYNFVHDRPSPMYAPENLSTAYSNKFADCIDADLLFMGLPQQWLTRLARRLGFGVPVSLEDIHEGAFWEHLRRRVRARPVDLSRVRAKWSVAGNAARLAGFYERIAPLA